MKLKTKCQHCREEFNLNKTFVTRPDLIAEMGEEFNLTCSHCLKIKTYHANDITAYHTLSAKVGGSLVGGIVILFVTMFFLKQGFITNIGLILGAGIIGASTLSSGTSNVKAFNKYLIRRKQ